MKIKNLIFGLLLTCAASYGQTKYPISLIWNGNNPAGSVEYFIEQKSGSSEWAETPNDKTQLETFTLQLVPGGYIFRVKARRTVEGNVLTSAPSNELVHLHGKPLDPSTLKITMNLIIREDGSIYNSKFNRPINFAKLRRENKGTS